MSSGICRSRLSWFLIILQVIFIVLYATTVTYSDSAHSLNDKGTENTDVVSYYGLFQDVHVMIFVGFGFLMAFLKRYGYSSTGINFLLAAFLIQWATLVGGYLKSHGHTIKINIETMLTSDFTAAAVLISFGALLGKVSPAQLVVMALIEVVVFSGCEHLGLHTFKVVDIGGSMFVHAFGAYFGLSVSRVLYRPALEESKKEGAVYHSDLFAMVGTIFLWLFWPSFNSALAHGDDRERAILNTYYAMAACCILTFATSSLLDRKNRFDMVHVQNASLAGGVAVGTCANLMIQPYGALILGAIAGIVSTSGYVFVTPFLTASLKTHDTCGVNNLHGMPSIVAGIAGAVTAAVASESTYGYSLYEMFPARVPASNTTEYQRIREHINVPYGLGRSGLQQGGYQMVALVVTICIAVVAGFITGVILKYFKFLEQPEGDDLFEDQKLWQLPEDEEGESDVNQTMITST